MITLEEAKQCVLGKFNDPSVPLGLVEGDVYAINDADTIEKRYGWIFHCNSDLYFRTRDHRYCARGLGPVIVDRRDGSIHVLETFLSHDYQIKAYEIGRLGLPRWLGEIIAETYMWVYIYTHPR